MKRVLKLVPPVVIIIGLLVLATGCSDKAAVEDSRRLAQTSESLDGSSPVTLSSEESKGNGSPTAVNKIMEFRIAGFTCANCADTARYLLSSVDGVKSVSVDPDGMARVVASKAVTLEQLQKALDQAGYRIESL